MRRIVILSDFHPSQFPGASGVALDLVETMATQYEMEFWFGSPDKKDQEFALDNTNYAIRGLFFANLSNRPPLRRLAKFLKVSKIVSSLWLAYNLLRFRPKILWSHNIGNVFPRTALLFAHLLRIKVIITYHDYTWLTFGMRKLYPSDLVNPSDFDEMGKFRQPSARLQKNLGLSRINIFYDISLIINRKLNRLASHNIFISQQQASIYSANKFRVDKIIPNPHKKCDCQFTKNDNFETIRILFAGRLIGKGLDKVVDLVGSNTGFHLHLAGQNDLLRYVETRLDSERYTFHGQLKQKELYCLLHRISLTACPSQCFDVYPSIVLESLAHGKPVAITTLCGNFPLVKRLAPELVFSPNSALDESLIRAALARIEQQNNNFDGLLPSKQNVLKEYRDILNLCLVAN